MNYKNIAVSLLCLGLLTQCAGQDGSITEGLKEMTRGQSIGAKEMRESGEMPDWVKSQGDGIYKLGKPYKVNGVWYFPKEDLKYEEVGIASWYGPGFHSKQTANGEVFDMDMVSGAHKTLPLPSVVKVTNLENGRSILVRINDRGPFVNDRLIDMSRKGAELLGFIAKGTAKVKVELMPEETMTVISMAQNKTYAGTTESQIEPVSAGVVSVGEDTSLSPSGGMVGTDFAPSAFSTSSPQTEKESPLEHAQEKDMMNITSEIEAHHQLSADDLQTKKDVVATVPTGSIYVQVGAFGNKANAEKVVNALSSVGKANLHMTESSGRTLYRVRFGPYDDTENAQKVFSKIRATGHQDAKILMQD